MEWIQYIYQSFVNFSNSVVSVLSYIWSMLQGLWYGMTTMLTGVFDIVGEIFNSGIF